MAVVDEGADRIWIAKIHTQLDAWVRAAFSIPIGNVYGVAKKRVIYGGAIPADKKKMDLVDVKIVQLVRAVLDRPVLDIALMDDDIRRGMWVINSWLLAIQSNEEKRRAVGIPGIGGLLGEIEL